MVSVIRSKPFTIFVGSVNIEVMDSFYPCVCFFFFFLNTQYCKVNSVLINRFVVVFIFVLKCVLF